MAHVIRFLVIGSPGSGKTTQAINLAVRNGLIHIDGSEILKRTVAENNSGNSARAVFQEMSVFDHQHGIVLSGFPKTASQARALDGFLAGADMPFDKVVFLDPPTAISIKRMKERARTGENSLKRRAKVRNFAKQREAILNFYRAKGILVEINSAAKERFVAKRLARFTKTVQKSNRLRERAMAGKMTKGPKR